MNVPGERGPTHGDVQVNGVRLHVVEAGPPDGPLVLLLHGFPEFWYAWRHVLPVLARAGFRAVAPDLRGYNLSDKPPGVASYHLDRLVEDVAALPGALGYGRAHVVGHDWGGIVAWALAMRRPEVLGRLVVLNAPHPVRFREELRRPAQLLRSWYVFFFQLPGVPEALIRAAGYPLGRVLRGTSTHPQVFSGADIARYREALMRPGALTATINYYRALRLRGELRGKTEVIRAPTLLIWGERDVALNIRLSEGLEPWVPGVRVVRLPGASHWVMSEEPVRVGNLLVDFLEGTSAAREVAGPPG